VGLVSACPKIGFTVNFDTARLSNGPRVLGLFSRNDRGDSITIPRVDNGGINVCELPASVRKRFLI